jgi:hypothetical protein
MPNRLIKTSYNSGEHSPLVDGRTDIAKYYVGCSKIVNAIPLPQGGFTKTPGTEYIATAKGKCKLIEFEFSASDNMLIEAGANYMRFYQDDVVETIEDSSVSAWVTDTAYSVNDIVDSADDNSLHYYCAEAHTSGAEAHTSFATDLAAGKWVVMTDYDTDTLIYEIWTPYSITEVFDMHITQSADVMYIACSGHQRQKLSRLATNSWTIADADSTGGPFLDENVDDTKTLTFTRTGGTAASGGYFPAGATGTLEAAVATPFQGTSVDVGSIWLLETTRTDNTTETPDNDTHAIPTAITNAVLTKGDFAFAVSDFDTDETVKLWRREGNGTFQEFRTFTAATSFSATEEFDDVYYIWTRGNAAAAESATGTFTAKEQNNKGIVKITAAVDTNTATVIVVDRVQQAGATTASPVTAMWAEGAWGEYRGYPQSVTFFEDRLWWGGTTNNPQTVWGSKTGDYEDHTAGTLADDAMVVTIQDNNMSSIQWIAARRSLVAGTANKEYAIRANNIDNPIKPDDVKASPQSTYGSDDIQPITLNDTLFYLQRSGRKVWAMSFSLSDEQFKSTDASRLSEHLFESAPVDMAVQGVPDPILWVVRTDGVLLSFTFNPDEEVNGWSRHVTGTMSANLLNGESDPDALYESVAIIAGSIEDSIYVSVQRYIDGSTVRYIEKFSTRVIDQIDEAMMLHSAKVVTSGEDSQNIVLASDTVRCGSGLCNSSLCGGTTS